jgi:hypothetical protein
VILSTIAPVIPRLRYVTIDQAQLRGVCGHIDPAILRLPAWDEDVFIAHPPQARAAQLLLFNTINFSYWGSPKWTIDFRGQPQDGAWGMLGSIARAVQDEDFPLFDGAYLASIPASDLRHILRGNVEIPMLQERLDILHEVGSVLVAQFDGSFSNPIRAAENDAVALVRLLVTRFPSFNDIAMLDGRTVAFYKRAQLATAMVYEAFGGEGLGDLRRSEDLTVFADYKLPQVLRRLGVLRYAPHLAERIDRLEPLESGSREEVEIRAATVWAGELMRRALVARLPHITPHSEVRALHIDYWLWREGQVQGSGIKPYHRTRTIYY